MILIFFCLFLTARSFAEVECPDLGQYEKALEGFKNNPDRSMVEILESQINIINKRSNFILELMPTKDSYVEGDSIDIKFRWTNISEKDIVVKYGDFGMASLNVSNLDLDLGGWAPWYPMLKEEEILLIKPGKFFETIESLPFVIKPESSGCSGRSCFESIKPGKYVVTIVGGDWTGKSLAVPDNKCYAQPIKPIEIIVIAKSQKGFWSWLQSVFNMKGKE